MPKKSELEDDLATIIGRNGLPAPERQYRAVEGRKWAWDFAWPLHMLLAEVDGGTWVQGRHNRGAGIEQDAEKQSAAAALGWRTLRLTGAMIESGRALELIEGALGVRPLSVALPSHPPVKIVPKRGIVRS